MAATNQERRDNAKHHIVRAEALLGPRTEANAAQYELLFALAYVVDALDHHAAECAVDIHAALVPLLAGD